MAALAFDLKTICGEDIRGLFTKPRKIGLREVIWWIRHFPDDSALNRLLRVDQEGSSASLQEHLNAQIINEIRQSNYQFALVNCDPKDQKSVPEPRMIELP